MIAQGFNGKESACSVGDLGSILGLRRSPGGGNGNPHQYSYLENPRGQRSLEGYSPWGCKESDMTKATKNELTSALVLQINDNTLPSIKSLFFPSYKLPE